MREEPTILLQGPRSVGKSTLMQTIADNVGAVVIDLDDLETRASVADDPALFTAGPSPVLVDEFQHVPELLDAIKAELNRDLRPGRFVLTGSTSFSTLPLTAQSLTGRLHRIDVWPLSQGEIEGTTERFLDALFADTRSLLTTTTSSVTRGDYARRILAGGFPLAIRRSVPARGRWFDDYVALVVERDVLELSKIRQRTELPRLLARLAAQTGQVLNIAKAGEAVGLTADLAERYTTLLESAFVLYRLPAWGRTLMSRTVAKPKLHLRDSGLAARLLRLDEERLLGLDAAALSDFGHLFETFCVNEVLKQASWMDDRPLVGHWRTHDGDEVDLILEGSGGRVVGVEVKAGSNVQSGDFSGLRKLRVRLGSSFAAGVVLHGGRHSREVDDRLYAMPAATLWA